MLTLINKNDYEEYLSKHPVLNHFENEFILFENDKYFYLPSKFYKNYPHEKLIGFNDPNINVKSIDLVFEKELRPYQVEPMQALENIYKTTGNINGIFEAKTGFGKTVMASYIASFVKQKTLIILDNGKLLEQWIDEIVNFTNLTVDDIGIIKGNKFQIDKPICIAMVQTLMSKVKRNITESYSKFREAGFGLVIFDEAHKTSSGPKYATSTLLLPCPNIIGLTATPFGQGLHKLLIENSIGEILYTYKVYDVKPRFYFIKYDSEFKELTPSYKKMQYYLRDYIKGIAFYNKHIIKCPRYFRTILQLTVKLVNAKHRVIIIASNVDQVQGIYDYLASAGVKNLKMLYSKQTEIDKEHDHIIIGTYKFCSHGFDYKELSALILASPFKGKTSLVQMIGRILRVCEGKNDPLVFDLIDEDMPTLFQSNISGKVQRLSDEFKLTSDDFRYIQL